jgi:serine/threonine protein kinase
LQQLGRYQILKELATGGIADVLLARASGLEGFTRHVVIKRIRRELAGEQRFVAAFLDEARIAASLHHHNIVQVYDIGEQDGAYFFAMEYVHSEDVRTLLARVRERNEVVPLDQVVAIITATAAGLHYAHEAVGPQGQKLDVVHRDVSPSNVLVGYDGSVKIVDFGLAKAAMRTNTTAAGTIRGKASYMSPEQCRGEKIDRRADIFGLGIVMYELVTAQRLFKGSTDYETMEAVVDGDVPPPSSTRRDVPPSLDAIILRALAKDPNERYQTAEAFREAVELFAVDAQLRTSNKALADYLVRLFGQRPEPWESEDVKPVTEDTEVGERGVAQPRKSAIRTVVEPAPIDDDDEDDDATFDGEAATTVIPDSPQLAAQMHAGEEPTLLGGPRARTAADEQSTVVGGPIFDDEGARGGGREEATAVEGPKRAASSRLGTELGTSAPPPPVVDPSRTPRSPQPLMPRPPSNPPRLASQPPAGPSSQQFAAPYATPSQQYAQQYATPSRQFAAMPPPAPVPQKTKWLAPYRSSIFIGGGAGIAIVAVVVVVMRACGG